MLNTVMLKNYNLLQPSAALRHAWDHCEGICECPVSTSDDVSIGSTLTLAVHQTYKCGQ